MSAALSGVVLVALVAATGAEPPPRRLEIAALELSPVMMAVSAEVARGGYGGSGMLRLLTLSGSGWYWTPISLGGQYGAFAGGNVGVGLFALTEGGGSWSVTPTVLVRGGVGVGFGTFMVFDGAGTPTDGLGLGLSTSLRIEHQTTDWLHLGLGIRALTAVPTLQYDAGVILTSFLAVGFNLPQP